VDELYVAQHAAALAMSIDSRLPIDGEFYLSHIKRGDEPAFVEHLIEPEISMNLLAIPHPYLPTHAAWWVSHCENTLNQTDSVYAVRDSAGRLVGEIGVVGPWTRGDHGTEFGYWLARPYWGRGLMTATVRVFAQHAFTSLGIERLFATPFTTSIASQRVLEKAGFHREGLLRSHHLKDHRHIDAFLYARLQHPSNRSHHGA
jgi:[ribosomal protein S5]-alanine N-acetyltransferase